MVYFFVCYYHVMYVFQSESTFYSCLNVKELLAQNKLNICLSDSKGIRNRNHLLCKHTQPFSQTGQMTELCCECLSVPSIWLYVIIMLHTCFGVNLHSIVAWVSRNCLLETDTIICISDSNRIWAHNHLVHKRTLEHLPRLAKWLSCVVSYLHGAFNYMLLSCQVSVSEWIYILYLPEY